jgi:alkylation response protein AidB-like acyl-CoA dehydrogenase
VSEGYAPLKEESFFKGIIPAELGGGAEYREICNAIRRIAASCGATALAFSMHSHLVAAAVWRWRHQNAPTDGLLRRVAADVAKRATVDGALCAQPNGG